MRDLSKPEMKYLVTLALRSPVREVLPAASIAALKKNGMLAKDGSLSDKGRTLVALLRRHVGV